MHRKNTKIKAPPNNKGYSGSEGRASVYAQQAGATNRLPAASPKRHDNYNLNLEVEGALPVACGRPLTFGKEMKDITKIEGKEYFSQLTNEGYGISEAFSGQLPEGFEVGVFGAPFAYDGCGNLFTENKKKEICFWDHETDELKVISESWEAFESGCVEPEPVELKDGQVKSVWIDPEFAKQMGIEVPSDGWKKRDAEQGSGGNV